MYLWKREILSSCKSFIFSGRKNSLASSRLWKHFMIFEKSRWNIKTEKLCSRGWNEMGKIRHDNSISSLSECRILKWRNPSCVNSFMLKTNEILIIECYHVVKVISTNSSSTKLESKREANDKFDGNIAVQETHLNRWFWLKSIVEMKKKATRKRVGE